MQAHEKAYFMKIFASVMALMLVGMALPAAAWAGQGDGGHPYLFFSDEKLERIRGEVRRPGSFHAEAFAALKARVDGGDLEVFGKTEDNWNYARSYLAQAAAFIYKVSGERRYAELAWDTLKAVHEDPDPDGRLPESGAHLLSRATVGLGFAIAYDWCRDAWTAAQREYILERLKVALDAWPGFNHPNLGMTRGSNWTAVCRGGELMMLIGAGLHEQRRERFDFLIGELRQHLDAGFDDMGVTQEGIGYTGYGGIFLLPAMLAARGVGDETLWAYVDRRAWWKQAMYTGTFAAIPGDDRLAGMKAFLMSGVGGPGIGDEGWASLLLATVPDDKTAYFLWWYDRHMGQKAPVDDPQKRFDYRRQGTMWALLYYPADVEPRDPTGVFPAAITSGRGQNMFRNRWADSDDILISLLADTTHHARGWAQSEALQMGLFAYDTLFFAGPRSNRDGEHYTKLLVDGQAGRASQTGVQRRFEAHERGGYAIVGGGEQYRHLGVREVDRHMLVRFDDADRNSAMIVMLDRIESLTEHLYTWNANIAGPVEAWDVGMSESVEQGRPVFTLRGRERGVVKGWVLSPEAAELQVGDPLRIEQRSASEDFWIVLWVGHGDAPKLEALELTAHGGRARIGGRWVGFDREAERVLIDADAARFDPRRADRPLPPRGLTARTLADRRIELRWVGEDLGNDHVLVQRRAEGEDEQAFQTVARLEAGSDRYVAEGLSPGTAYEWRVAGEKDGRSGEPSQVAEATTWERGYAVYVEDFAPRVDGELPAENALGHWSKLNQDRGWVLSNAEGSPRNAVARRGRMETAGRTRINNHNIFYTEGFRADLSGESAAIEFDAMVQGTTRMTVMLKLGDGTWVRRDGFAYVDSRHAWQTQRFNIDAADDWVEVEPERFRVVGPRELTADDLAGVHGLGVWAHWPLNERWARIDQLHLYARDLEFVR